MMPDFNQDESRIVQAVEKAIAWANTGLSPNEAIQKVAVDEQFSPTVIARMVEAFNKSKSVFMLKNAAEDERAKPFELANTAEIVEAIFTAAPSQEKTAKARLPNSDFAGLGLLPPQEKTAKAEENAPTLPIHSFARRLEKYASFCSKVLETMSFRVAQRRRDFSKAIEKAAEEIQKLPPSQLRKTAQMIHNGYPESGPKLIKILEAYTRCNFPELQKTAHGVVFPADEPYLSIARVYDAANRWAEAKNAQILFEKDAQEGAGLFREFLRGEGEFGHVKTAASGIKPVYQSFLGSSIAAAGLGAEDKGEEDKVIDVVEPGVFNRLKELEARRTLMQLVLYDPELSQYEMPELVRAYNESVSSVPDAYKHSSVLKNMMLQNLETKGVKDPYQLQQEVTLGKNLAQMQQARTGTQKEELSPEKTQ
jgi:hypothetical protein